MRRNLQDAPLTPAELELMDILWKTGPATVQMVLDRLPLDRCLAYTTVQTVLGVLHRKRKVARTYKNRAYHYDPAVSRAAVANMAVGDLLKRLFGGEPERLVMSMIETKQLTPAKIADLQRLLDDALKSAR